MSTSNIVKPETQLQILEFFIFNRNGICLTHLDLQEDPLIPNNRALNLMTDKKNENRYKLIFGLLFSMKSFIKNVSPNKSTDFFKCFLTSTYKLHYLEFLNGLRFVIISTPTKLDFSAYLKEIYSAYFVNFISKNIFINKEEPIKNEIFLESVTNYLNSINSSITN
jgi:hypothetical protein